jgi:ABC-type antimicrobial peptide transport system permease subunit
MWDVDAFGKVGFDARYNKIMLKLKDSGEYRDTEEILTRLKVIYPEFRFESRRENSENREMIQKTAQSVYTSVTVMIAVFGLLSLYAAEKAKIQEQKRVWGSLRAAGIERKHAYIYQLSEITLNMLLAWVFALLLSLFCAYIIRLSVDVNIPWYSLISWPGAVGALVVFEALGLCVSLPQMSGIFKKNIISLISYE